jgi:uncharacterized protein
MKYLAPACALSLAAALAAPASQPGAASFDCAKAKSAVEKMICADSELSMLDWTSADYYRKAGTTMPGAKSCLRDDQRAWLAKLRNACKDKACLKRVYLDRLAELYAVQPARMDGEPMELPKRPYLVGIIPPTDHPPDSVESDPASAPALAVTGKLTQEEGGYMLHASGKEYDLMSWYFDPQVMDQTNAAMADPVARFTVSGRAGKNSASGRTYFEPRRCIYIHQQLL